MFEYSSDGVSWVEIWTEPDLFNDVFGPSLPTWVSLWDTVPIDAGEYSLRVTMESLTGDVGVSPIVLIGVGKPPRAVATATHVERGKVKFDGSGSTDPDGTIVSWEWDFGDGQTGSGEVVEHSYTDLTKLYDVTLAVTDNDGCADPANYELSFEVPESGGPVPLPVFNPDPECICEKIEIRTTGEALGTDGVDLVGGGDKHWPAAAGFDGKTLGPLHANPANAGVEKPWTGFAFEIVCTVKGDPDACEQTQLVKATFTKGGAAIPHAWSGAGADRDLDGVNDLKANTAADCAAGGGTWVAPKCTWPEGGAKYAPDTPFNGNGLYDDPYDFKKHPPLTNKIIWVDAPQFPAAYSALKADFIAIVRGTDGKYCYVRFSIDYARKVGKDQEDIGGPAPGNKPEEKIGQANVPGVP